MGKAQCGTCRFYDDEAGMCRKYAPWPLVKPRSYAFVTKQDWCGEYQPTQKRKLIPGKDR